MGESNICPARGSALTAKIYCTHMTWTGKKRLSVSAYIVHYETYKLMLLLLFFFFQIVFLLLLLLVLSPIRCCLFWSSLWHVYTRVHTHTSSLPLHVSVSLSLCVSNLMACTRLVWSCRVTKDHTSKIGA